MEERSQSWSVVELGAVVQREVHSRPRGAAAPSAPTAPVTASASHGRSFAPWASACFHLMTAMMGTGLLGLPYALASLGWVLGLLTLAFITASSAYSAYLLAQLHTLKDGRRVSTLRALSTEVLGAWGGRAMAAFQLTAVLAALLVYTIAGGTAIMALVHDCAGARASACAQFEYVAWPWALAFGGAMALLVQVPDIRSLVGISLIGALTPFVYGSVALVSMIAAGRVPSASHSIIQRGSSFGTAMNMCQALGAIAYCWDGQMVQNEVAATLPGTSHAVLAAMRRALGIAFALIASIYFALAATGFGLQGNQVPGNILLAIPHKGAAVLAQVALLLQVSASYGVFGIGLFQAIEDALKQRSLVPAELLTRPWLLRLAVRTSGVAAFTFVATLIPFFNQVAGLNGGLAVLPMCFIAPILMYQVYHADSLPLWRALLHWALVATFGCLACVATVGSVTLVIQNASSYHLFA